MSRTTIPTHALDCPCDLCEDMPVHTVKRYSYRAEQALQVSPLARAALDNGVDFSSVEQYILSRMTEAERNQTLAGNLYGALLADYTKQAVGAFHESAQESLDVALRDSWLAQLDGSIAALRLWWRGVLP